MKRPNIIKKIFIVAATFLVVCMVLLLLYKPQNIYAAEAMHANEIKELSNYDRANLYMKMILDIPKEKLIDLSYVDIHYSLTENEQKEIKEFTELLVSDLVGNKDKALRVHDWITENIYYDYDGCRSGNGISNPYSAFKTRKAACGGFTSLYMTMLRSIEIPCIDADGIANNGNHAWNVVITENDPFVVDCTWDTNNTYRDGEFKKGEVSHKYYNCDLEWFLSTHEWEQTIIYDMKIGDFTYGYFRGFGENKDQINISKYIGNGEEVVFPNQAYGYNIYGTALASPYDGKIHHNLKRVKKVTFSEGIEHIRQGIFPSYCTALRDIILPSSLKSFDFSDFVSYIDANYQNVKLEFLGVTPPDFENSSFVKSKNVIIVPKGCVELYKRALNDAGETDCKVYEKGQKINISGFTYENNSLQYYDSKGKKAVSKLISIEGDTYYFDKNGNAYSGLKTIEKNTYYFDIQSCKMIKNKIVKILDKEYYFDKNGILVVNKSITIQKVVYKADKKGVLKRVK